jgi:hypothetical protein
LDIEAANKNPAVDDPRKLSFSAISVVSPELRDVTADNATIAEINQALKHDQGSRLGDSRQSGLLRSNINWCAGHNKLAHLGRESSGIDQR